MKQPKSPVAQGKKTPIKGIIKTPKKIEQDKSLKNIKDSINTPTKLHTPKQSKIFKMTQELVNGKMAKTPNSQKKKKLNENSKSPLPQQQTNKSPKVQQQNNKSPKVQQQNNKKVQQQNNKSPKVQQQNNKSPKVQQQNNKSSKVQQQNNKSSKGQKQINKSPVGQQQNKKSAKIQELSDDTHKNKKIKQNSGKNKKQDKTDIKKVSKAVTISFSSSASSYNGSNIKDILFKTLKTNPKSINILFDTDQDSEQKSLKTEEIFIDGSKLILKPEFTVDPLLRVCSLKALDVENVKIKLGAESYKTLRMPKDKSGLYCFSFKKAEDALKADKMNLVIDGYIIRLRNFRIHSKRKADTNVISEQSAPKKRKLEETKMEEVDSEGDDDDDDDDDDENDEVIEDEDTDGEEEESDDDDEQSDDEDEQSDDEDDESDDEDDQ